MSKKVYVEEVVEKDERDEILIKALYKLPRPTIIFTTEVEDAQKIRNKLKSKS